MKNKIVAVLMASVLGVCTLAGCGNNNAQETVAEETTQTETETEENASTETEEATEEADTTEDADKMAADT